jgi:hypothetical protein
LVTGGARGSTGIGTGAMRTGSFGSVPLMIRPLHQNQVTRPKRTTNPTRVGQIHIGRVRRRRSGRLEEGRGMTTNQTSMIGPLPPGPPSLFRGGRGPRRICTWGPCPSIELITMDTTLITRPPQNAAQNPAT